MLRWLPCAILVACTPTDAVQAEQRSAAPPAPSAVVDAAAPPIATPTPAPPHAAFPSGALVAISGPRDADFVLTTDTGGGIRLWPSLDGSREPVIIPSHAALRAEAIHDGDGIAIAALDIVGQVEIIRTTRDGAVLERTTVALPRPVIGLATTAHAFIAMRDDQRFAAFDVHGRSRGEVVPDPGVRVTGMLQGRDHVIAMLEGKRQLGRAFELGAGELHWGATSAPLALDLDRARLLSPDGTRIAGTHEHDIVVLELATGKQIASSYSGLALPGSAPSILAFPDDQTVWFTSDEHMYEWKIGLPPLDPQPRSLAFAHVTAHAFTWIENDEVGVFANHATHYLGYHMAQVTDLVAAGDGWVGTDGNQVCHFDEHLTVDRMYPQPREQPFSSKSVTLVDARHAVLSGYGLPQSVYLLGSSEEPATMATYGNRFQFQRSTGIAVVDGDRTIQFAKWNPATAAFGDVIAAIDRPEPTQNIRIYDPAASSGLIAAYVTIPAPDYSIHVTRISKLDPVTSRDRAVASTKNLVGSESVFSQLDLFLPPKPAYAPSADGTLIAELLDGRITLRDRAGNERWARTAHGAIGLAWNANDQLVAFGQGAAYVDLETGDFVGARCGWRFALWDKPSFTQGGAEMCASDE